MNKTKIENLIISNRGNREVLNGIAESMLPIKEKTSWKIDKLLKTYCKGIEGLSVFDLGGNVNIRRYYDHLCKQYRDAEHIISVTKAYSK